jgi:nonsense-mediated mRNA decay protein 3
MFCVVCGAEGETYDGLCKECFISRGHFVEVPENVDVTLCAHCGAMMIGSHWEHITDTTERAVQGAIRVSKGVELDTTLQVEDEDERNFRVTVGLHILLPDKDFEFFDTKQTRLRIKNGCCIECSRESGSYYEAVLQLRAKDRKLTQEEIDEVVAKAKKLAAASHSFVSKIETVKGGVDLYMGKNKDGKALSSLLVSTAGASTTETITLAGRKDGQDLYRWTLLVRLPPFQRGDILPMDGKLWEIRSFTKKSANLQEITSGDRDSRPMDKIVDLPVIKKEGAIREAVVVSDHGDDLQIMHPDNYSTVDIKKPMDYKEGKKEISIVIYEGEIYPYLLSKGKEEI